MTSLKIFQDKKAFQGDSLERPKVFFRLRRMRPCLPVRSRTQAGRSWPLFRFRGETSPRTRELTSETHAGFTLIEILIVIAIFLALAALTLGIGVDTARRATVGGERTLLVELLERARSHAMNNIGEMPHGVAVNATDFVLFQGATYSSTDPLNEVSARSEGITVTGPTDPVTVVFAQLSGRVDAGQTGNVVLSNGDQTATIALNTEGRIDW